MGRKAGIESREDRVHGYIVRDDGLLLELKLLEDIGLEGRLGDYFVRACQQSIFFFWHGLDRRDGGEETLTVLVVLPTAQSKPQQHRVHRPLALHNDGAYDE